MRPVTSIVGTAVPLERSNIDTDQIIPSDWLKRIERTGFEEGLFSEWRQDPNFVLNDQKYAGAKILIAGENFGIGSSREHAVWALQQYGFEAVISPSFGDIFANNASKNGLVTITFDSESCSELIKTVKADASSEISIDVQSEQLNVEQNGINFDFKLAPAVKSRLIQGLDDIAISLQEEQKIADYEARRPSWLR